MKSDVIIVPSKYKNSHYYSKLLSNFKQLIIYTVIGEMKYVAITWSHRYKEWSNIMVYGWLEKYHNHTQSICGKHPFIPIQTRSLVGFRLNQYTIDT